MIVEIKVCGVCGNETAGPNFCTKCGAPLGEILTNTIVGDIQTVRIQTPNGVMNAVLRRNDCQPIRIALADEDEDEDICLTSGLVS